MTQKIAWEWMRAMIRTLLGVKLPPPSPPDIFLPPVPSVPQLDRAQQDREYDDVWKRYERLQEDLVKISRGHHPRPLPRNGR